MRTTEKMAWLNTILKMVRVCIEFEIVGGFSSPFCHKQLNRAMVNCLFGEIMNKIDKTAIFYYLHIFFLRSTSRSFLNYARQWKIESQWTFKLL